MLIAKGNNLFYYTMKSETSNHLYEIDFLTSVKDKICPLEVKSGNYRTHKSLDAFCNKFSNRIGGNMLFIQKITNGKTEFIIFQCIWYHFYKDFLETYIFIRQQVVKDVE